MQEKTNKSRRSQVKAGEEEKKEGHNDDGFMRDYQTGKAGIGDFPR